MKNNLFVGNKQSQFLKFKGDGFLSAKE